MRQINLIQLGCGNIGSEFVNQVLKQSYFLRKNLGIYINWVYLGRSKTAVFDKNGLGEDLIKEFLKNENQSAEEARGIQEVLSEVAGSIPTVLVDLTAESGFEKLYQECFKKNISVVTANKKPMACSLKVFKEMINASMHSNVFFGYEATVGAGLPILNNLQKQILTGDELVQLKGCFSGTLSYVFSELDKGLDFSEVIADAWEKGYTEPDPRDDLSGADVARKALILSRLCGFDFEYSDIKVQNLVPEPLLGLNLSDFRDNLEVFNEEFGKKLEECRSSGKVLRYVANVCKDEIEIGLQSLSSQSSIGGLKGTNNICEIETKRYHSAQPLVISGPGAGKEVTAAGVFVDLLRGIGK